MNTEDIKEAYQRTCFELGKKNDELEQLKTDIFILNPKFKEIINEITFLEKEKRYLEDLMNE